MFQGIAELGEERGIGCIRNLVTGLGECTLSLKSHMVTPRRHQSCETRVVRYVDYTIGRHSTDHFRAVGTRNAHASKGSLGCLGVGQWAQA
jgi:hypothetical protein